MATADLPDGGAASAGGRAGGVIHDIGYRHFTGTRLGTGTAVRALLVETLRGSYGFGRSAKSKVMPLLLLGVMCLPPLIMSIVTSVTGADDTPASPFDMMQSLFLVTLIFLAGQAPQAVSRDLRYRVTSLYFSRPLRREQYVFAKVAAMTLAVFLLIAIPLTILFAGALLAELPIGDHAGDYLLALLTALILAFVLAAISLFIASVTPRRGFGVAAVFAVLFLLFMVAATLQGVGIDEDADGLARYGSLLSPFSLVDISISWVFGRVPVNPVHELSAARGLAHLATLVVVTVVFLVLLLRRYRKVSAS